MTRDEKIYYVKKLFYPLGTDRMIVAYSQYFKGKGRKTTIDKVEEDFRNQGKKNGHSDNEIEQGIIYMQELAKD